MRAVTLYALHTTLALRWVPRLGSVGVSAAPAGSGYLLVLQVLFS